jgi:hypothetical protein
MKKSFLTGIALIALVVFPSQVFAADTSTLQAQLMTYLPYILIGGAVILLISIVGILLSKKKEKSEETSNQTPTPAVESTPPTVFAPEVETPVQPVNMDNISTNLYSPAEAKPTIQETMESNTTSEEMPIAQPEFSPSVAPVAEQTQSSDLQDILQGEASASPMGPVTDHVAEESPVAETSSPSFDTPVASTISSFAPDPMPANTETSVTPAMDTQFSSPATEQPIAAPVEPSAFPSFNTAAPEVTTAVPDLQQFVNNQVAEVPPMAAPVMETPAPVAAPVETPMPDFNQAPATTDTTTPTQTGTPFSI